MSFCSLEKKIISTNSDFAGFECALNPQSHCGICIEEKKSTD